MDLLSLYSSPPPLISSTSLSPKWAAIKLSIFTPLRPTTSPQSPVIIYLFLKDINHMLFPFFLLHLFPYIRAAKRVDRGMAFKGKSNRSGDIKKQRGSLEGKSGWKCKRGKRHWNGDCKRRGCMKVKNEAQRRGESEMDGLFSLPCELICSNASLRDKYSYMNASVIWQSAAPPVIAALWKPSYRPSCTLSAVELLLNL